MERKVINSMVRAAVGKRARQAVESGAFKVSDEDRAMAILAGAIRCPGWRHYKKGASANIVCIICQGDGMVDMKDVPATFLGLWITLAERGRRGQSMDTEDIIDELDGGDGTTGGGGILEEM